MTEAQPESSLWKIHDERLVDDTRRARVSIASVELPNGVTFEQWVLRLPKASIVAVVDDQARVLMLWRHRFIPDRWVWELPGGYVDENEPPEVTAAREVEEETGWRPEGLKLLAAVQPMVGTADAENLLFASEGATYTGSPADINEAARVEWVPLSSVLGLIAEGKIIGAASVAALCHVLATRGSVAVE
ncbi:NUDIX hydrolase [Longispora albida]|uniref:NUDIX hydrolase n=1 Tax=Longispora albida TaxID=203523 RepID=UPI0003821140|nr:NUDIX hydrolase [Longispora albida]